MSNKQLLSNMVLVVHVKSSHQERILADMHETRINGYTIWNNELNSVRFRFTCIYGGKEWTGSIPAAVAGNSINNNKRDVLIVTQIRWYLIRSINDFYSWMFSVLSSYKINNITQFIKIIASIAQQYFPGLLVVYCKNSCDKSTMSQLTTFQTKPLIGISSCTWQFISSENCLLLLYASATSCLQICDV